MIYRINGVVTVSCWTEVEADTEQDAIEIAKDRTLAEISISGGYDLSDFWHMDTDGSPKEFVIED